MSFSLVASIWKSGCENSNIILFRSQNEMAIYEQSYVFLRISKRLEIAAFLLTLRLESRRIFPDMTSSPQLRTRIFIQADLGQKANRDLEPRRNKKYPLPGGYRLNISEQGLFLRA